MDSSVSTISMMMGRSAGEVEEFALCSTLFAPNPRRPSRRSRPTGRARAPADDPFVERHMLAPVLLR
jgi:hypothetical protein